jgi:gliding motility-associated lipoprotein GldH
MIRLFRFVCITGLLSAVLYGCTTNDLYEKVVLVPGHQWKSSFKPVFTFTIKDTAALYDINLVLRHTEKYSFNNLWVQVSYQAPGEPVQKLSKELELASNEKGWGKSGTGMDDLYEHRLPLNETGLRFSKAGVYTFTIEHIMREDPLAHVMNVGLRVEKHK